MSCEHPILAAQLAELDGKKKIKLLGGLDWNIKKAEEMYGHENLLLFGCGKCLACKAAHQKEWAVRCELESRDHKESCMITLTYEERLRPRKLVKRDFKEFIKKLRNRGLHFRYFGCGEYSQAGYPHYHICLFGYWPKDAKFDYNSKAGYPVYRSNFISSVWKRGIISVSEMSPGTAAYVAGYVDKKLGQDEFILMSKKPGIGEHYLRTHLFEIFKYDNIVTKGGIANVPRYASKLADYAWMDISDIVEKRKQAVNKNVVELMNIHKLEHKDLAVGYIGKLKHESLSRKERL